MPSYTVTFKNYDGSVIDTQFVKLGDSAVAPAQPERPDDGYYSYTFAGWDKEFTNITGDITVTAVYDETAIDHDTSGYLELKVSGGTDIHMSVNGGPMRPQGTHYYNHHMNFGEEIKVTAVTTNDNVFVGWVNAVTGDILTTERTYAFYTTGNDVLIAFPDDPSFLGYEFVEWDHTEEEIKALISQGEDVTVYPVWSANDVYVSITVNGGTIKKSSSVNADGKYLAYKSTIVAANDAPKGQLFSHWEDADGNILSYDKEYKFSPYKDVELTATYVSIASLKIDIVGVKPQSSGKPATNKVYLQLLNNWKDDDNAVFAAYVWGETQDDDAWYEFAHISGNIYLAEIPVKYTNIILASMNSEYDVSQWNIDDTTGILLHKSVGFTVPPEDEHNMVILTADGGYGSDNIYTTYFVNDRGLENVNAYYTDNTGTQKAMVKFVQKDVNGNDVYSVQLPAYATSVMFTDGVNEYTYNLADGFEDRSVFKLLQEDKKVLVNAEIDSSTLGDRNTIFFSWSVPEETEYTFISAGVLFADKDDYSESTFVVGTLDTSVTQFTPSKKYQTSTGMHSITKLGVQNGDEMIARAFVMYRDRDGVIRIAYSDIVTAIK